MSKYKNASLKGYKWLKSKLLHFPHELTFFYKAPALLGAHGDIAGVQLVLREIQKRFLQDNGDFKNTDSRKSDNPAISEYYYCYPNVWILCSAHSQFMHPLSYKAWDFLKKHYCPKAQNFFTHDGVQEMANSATVGSAALAMGDLDKAEGVARFFLKLVKQKGPFYCRAKLDGTLIKEFLDSPFHVIDKTKDDQLFALLGIAMAYLVKIYRITKKSEYLEGAKAYLEHCLSCEGNIRASFPGHKVAYGASLYYSETNDPKALKLAKDIADYLVAIQNPDGSYFEPKNPYLHVDQTVEISYWLAILDPVLSR